MKSWKRPTVVGMTAEQLTRHIQAAAMSYGGIFCMFVDAR